MSDSIYKSPSGEKQIMEFYDNALRSWPVSYEGLEINTRHGNTFVIASGEKTAAPLVLLHGSASNSLSWMGDVADYCRHFRVYAVDMPGEPGKSSQNRPAWNSNAYVEWMEDLLRGLGLQKASLAGLSQGGWIALKFATARPEAVEKLVLLTPGGIVPGRISFLFKAIVLTMFGRRGAEAINRIVFGKQAINENALKFMNLIMTNFKVRIEPQHIFTDEELQRLTMPVLLLIGAKDSIIPTAKVADRVGKTVPGIKVKLYPEMGHVLINLTHDIIPFLLEQE